MLSLPRCHTARERQFHCISLVHNWTAVRFWDGPIVFQVLARFTTSASNKHSVVRHLWNPDLLVRSDMRFEAHCESHTLHRLSSQERPSFCEHLTVRSPNIAFTYNAPFVNIWPSSWLGQMKFCNGSDGEESLLQGALSLKQQRNPGAAGRITCTFRVTSKPQRITREKTQGKWTRRMRRIPAKRIFFAKSKDLGAVGRNTYKFTVTLKVRRVLLENTHERKGPVYMYCQLRRLGNLPAMTEEDRHEQLQSILSAVASQPNLADTRVSEWDKEERVCLTLDSMDV